MGAPSRRAVEGRARRTGVGGRGRIRAVHLAVALSVAAILVATLRPAPGEPTLPVSLCLLCGDHGLADAIANVLLFLPLGLSCALAGVRPGRAVAAAALLSAAVELTQFGLPGRDPSVGDVVFNTLGAALGVLAARAVSRPRPRALPAPAAALAALAALAVVAATGVLLRPSPPSGVYYGQWTARLGNLASYDGRVLAATLGGLPLPDGRLRQTHAVAGGLRAGAPLDVRALAGHAPPALAPLLSIYSGDQDEAMLLGFDGADLVFRSRTRGRALRLDAPDARLHGAATGLRPGEPMTILVERRGADTCLGLNGRIRCGLGNTAGRGWALIYYIGALPAVLVHLLDAAWLALLLVPVGATLKRSRWTLLALALAAGGLLLLPPAVGLLPLGPAGVLGALAGLGAGALLQAHLAARRRALGDPQPAARRS